VKLRFSRSNPIDVQLRSLGRNTLGAHEQREDPTIMAARFDLTFDEVVLDVEERFSLPKSLLIRL
jgi:hypothetical protein